MYKGLRYTLIDHIYINATLIDHIYYNLGNKQNVDTKIICGNFLQDISDHLPNYLIIYNENCNVKNQRPMIRIFSEKNKAKFLEFLRNVNWESVHSLSDANEAYNEFADIVYSGFEKFFPFTKLSRSKSKDKKWITEALRKSSKTKNKLYKKWLISKSLVDETNYKNYRKICRKVAAEAENTYYISMLKLIL